MKVLSFFILVSIALVVFVGAYFSLKASISNNSNFGYLASLAKHVKESTSTTDVFKNKNFLPSTATATSVSKTKATTSVSVPLSVTAAKKSSVTIKPMTQVQSSDFSFADFLKSKGKEFGVWLWRSPKDMSPDEMRVVIDQIASSGFTSVYITIDDYLDIRSVKRERTRELAYEKYETSLDTFLTLAVKKNIAVDVEAGGKEWAFPKNRHKAFEILSFASAYNKRSINKIRAVQFDIEPYDLPHYERNKETYLGDFLEMTSLLVSQAEKEGISLSLAIPEFYDSVDEATKLLFDGKNDLPFNHLVRIMGRIPKNSLVIMAYSDTTEGELGSIRISQNEVSQGLLGAYPVKIIIGQETGNVDSEGRPTLSPSVTFYGQSKSYFFSQLRIIYDTYSSYPAYGGFAVHYLDTFLFLKDK